MKDVKRKTGKRMTGKKKDGRKKDGIKKNGERKMGNLQRAVQTWPSTPQVAKTWDKRLYSILSQTLSWGRRRIGSTSVSFPRHSATTFRVPSSVLSQWLNSKVLERNSIKAFILDVKTCQTHGRSRKTRKTMSQETFQQKPRVNEPNKNVSLVLTSR